jgi:hypothetical protein
MRQVYENYKNWGYRQGLADIDLSPVASSGEA